MVLCRPSYSGKELSDWMTELPWSNKSKINTDLKMPKILDEDHYGLEKLKRE